MSYAATAITNAQRAYSTGAIEECERLCREALRRERDQPDALRLLGMIELRRNRPDEAAAFFAREVRARPRDAAAYRMLAKARLGQDRAEEAVRLCDDSLRLDPRNALTLETKANALVQGRRKAEAVDMLHRLIETEGDATPSLVALHASLTCTPQNAGELAERLERALRTAGADPGARLKLLYARGTTLDMLARHADAFASWMEAKRVFPATYDRAGAEARTRSIIEFYSPERVPSMPRARVSGAGLCFVVGMPRTGSTLVERMLDAHPAAVGIGESTWLPQLVDSLQATLGAADAFPHCLGGASEAALTRIARTALNRVRREITAAGRSPRGGGAPPLVVDKNLANHRHIGLAATLFPGARVVHCVREPRDVALSCVMRNLSPLDHPYTRDLADLAHAWVQCQRLMRHWLALAATLGIAITECRYEELVADPEGRGRELVAFCGLEWDDACLRFHESERAARTLSMQQVREPVHRRAVERWRRYEAELEPFERERLALLGAPP